MDVIKDKSEENQKDNNMKQPKAKPRYGFIVVCLLIAFALIAIYVLHQFPKETIRLQQQTLYQLPKGTGFNQMCRQLVKLEVVSRCGPLKWYSKFHPELRMIKQGTYMLEPGMTHLVLLQLLASGKEHQFSFTLIEGERLRDILKKLAKQPYLTQDLPATQDLAKKLGSEHSHLEGLLYPDTYHYAANSSAFAIIERAYDKMQVQLQQLWQQRQADLPYQSPYEALIMASIIEKETAVAIERPLIAAVFVNRLNKKMRLQTDPTVIYGLGDAFDGDITRAHLRQKTAYNTYRINGLPPTPIAMPASKAIEAALNPVASEFLYFVAKKDGSHQFSKTLAEHNKAVRRYQLNKE